MRMPAGRLKAKTASKGEPREGDGRNNVLEIDGRKVKLTRVDKLLYPAAGFTKAHVIDYYVRVAPFLLPHLRDRPITLKRFPDGVRGEAYWDKDVPSFAPDWVQTFPVPRHAGGPDINYLLINDGATLAWTANIAALELHPFLHKVPNIFTPTSVVFDLDPGEGSDIFSCIEVAQLIRAVCDRLGLQLLPKVSGSKGIQLYLPLNTPVTYTQTQPFARAMAQLMETQNPRIAVSDMAKSKRVGKVFIDWSQNADHKTTVGVYSLRAKSGRPYVSMPVRWDELEKAAHTKDRNSLYFEPDVALRRLKEIGDLFAPVLELKQSLPVNIDGGLRSAVKPVTTHRGRNTATESAPRSSSQGGRRRFVIQKHAATHLHYDLRLEIHGALKSWAVPKGLPTTRGERRLATTTADHPLEYFDFEGVIPQGQYGAGTVMVWDIGTYEIVEGNYWKGNLHVAFAGKKLKGEWLLSRDAAKGPKAWVIEKIGDDATNISKKKDDRSALTGRTMEQIAAARDAVWHSNRLPAGVSIDFDSLPHTRAEFVEPMQCRLVAQLPAGDEWEYEAKFDGYRAIVIKSKDVALMSRRNNPLTNDFPEIAAAFAEVDPDTVIDGELVALGENGRPAFNLLQNHARNRKAVQFYAFDIPMYRGRSLLGVPLAQRRALLRSVISTAAKPAVQFSESFDVAPDQLIAAAKKLGMEGVVAKQVNSVYEPGKRSGAWAKFKLNLGQELVVGGYIPAPKRHFDALLVGYHEGDRLIFAGKIRNGFKEPRSKERVFARFQGLGTSKCPFDNLPEPRNARRGMALTADAMKLCCWLKPKLVAQVGIREWTRDGHLRHSTFLGLRDDKQPEAVTRESPI